MISEHVEVPPERRVPLLVSLLVSLLVLVLVLVLVTLTTIYLPRRKQGTSQR